MMRRLGIFGVLIACCSLLSAPGAVSAQSVIEASVTISEAERQVRMALAASSATLEATKRQSDRALWRKLFEIEELQADIAALQAGGEVATARIEALRDNLAAQQQRFIDELAERDRVYGEAPHSEYLWNRILTGRFLTSVSVPFA